jgi:hypothetical protein
LAIMSERLNLILDRTLLVIISTIGSAGTAPVPSRILVLICHVQHGFPVPPELRMASPDGYRLVHGSVSVPR